MTSSSKGVLALSALLAAAAAQASTSASISGVQNVGGIDYQLAGCAGCVVQGAHTDDHSDGSSAIAAYARGDYGVLKAAVSATGTGLGTVGRSTASAAFSDQFEIDAAGLTGHQGHFQARVSMPFDAALTTDLLSSANLTAFVQVNDGETWSETWGAGGGDAVTRIAHNDVLEAPGTPMILDVAFTFGEPIKLLAYLDVQVAGTTLQTGGSFDGHVDAAHSIYWNGIGQVTDAAGNPATAYTLTSDSGTDWRRDFQASAVPEPAGIALLFAGLGVVALRRRTALR